MLLVINYELILCCLYSPMNFMMLWDENEKMKSMILKIFEECKLLEYENYKCKLFYYIYLFVFEALIEMRGKILNVDNCCISFTL